MANFQIAEKITGGNEGGYANNPSDTGGETWTGVSRNNFPTWSGWIIIDQIKRNYGKDARTINKHGFANSQLKILVSDFYKKNFWDINKLDQFVDQQVANTVYDFGVNSGTSRAAKFLQEVLGFTGKDVDGKIGPKTLEYVNKANAEALHAKYNCKREVAYRSWAVGNQAQFLKSWLSRLKTYTK